MGAPVPVGNADATTTEVLSNSENPWHLDFTFAAVLGISLRVSFLVIDALLNVVIEMAGDRLKRNLIQFVTREPRSLLSLVISFVCLSSSLCENVEYFYRVKKDK